AASILQPARAGVAPEYPVLGAVAAARVATVTILTPGADGEDEATGAGFLDAVTGLIITNAHVVGDRPVVRMGTAGGMIVEGRVVARDALIDIAVIEAALPGVGGLSFSPATAWPGETVYAVGSPFGLGHTVTRGIVSALDRAIDATTPFGMIQHDAPLNPGSSGGPVIDERGRVIGINTAMPDGFRRDVGIAYAIPADVALRTVTRLARGETIAHRELGVSLRALAPRLAEAIGLAPGSGALVESVAPNSAAWRAGMAASDVILRIGDMPIERLRDVAVGLFRADPSAGLAVEILRGNDRLTLMLAPATATAEARPAKRGDPDRTAVEAENLGMTLSEGGAARVLALAEHGPAAAAGVVAGDIILAVGRVRVASAADAKQLIGNTIFNPFALLLLARDGTTRYVVVDPWAAGLDGDGLGGNMRNPKSATF
ncbi:MAG: trypsin-like peptidase domain-containing protein, partial [Bauldia sp.]